ncbi:MAG: alanine--glyoxylate aminotransferase family protein [Oscillospiraceae bacterium]|nr:alanine--glyoxylate aminotransferase family protein [Oscillospiraceae bacterium]
MKLFIPGPVDVAEDVLQKMATPMIGHRGKAASALQKSISEKLQKVFFTNNTIVLSTTSGSGLMEASVNCCTAKGAAVFSVGAFGDRWGKMAKANGKPVDVFKVEPGMPTLPEDVDKALATGKYDLVTVTHNETSTGVMNPVLEIGDVIKKYPEVVYCVDAVSSMGGVKIDVDGCGIDICVTSTQKCLGLPPGLSICSVSAKALERAKSVENRGLYLDLVELCSFIETKNYQYPSTPSLSHMFALDYQLTKILETEGLENRFARHAELAARVQKWANLHFKVLAKEGYQSVTVTAIENTKNIDVGALVKELESEGFLIGNGYGELKDKTFRIAHMAERTIGEIEDLLSRIDKKLGF